MKQNIVNITCNIIRLYICTYKSNMHLYFYTYCNSNMISSLFYKKFKHNLCSIVTLDSICFIYKFVEFTCLLKLNVLYQYILYKF